MAYTLDGRAKAEGLSELLVDKKNDNVAWFDTEFQLEKFQLLALLVHFEYYRDGIKLSIKPWEDTAGSDV